MKAGDFQIGDTVRLSVAAYEAYCDATIRQIDEESVHLFRPYVHTADFSYTGGVICYVGIEQWSVAKNSVVTWDLLSRKKLR